MKLSDREWKDFPVPYVFQKIQRGKRLKKADHISGIVPYVSSTANNNGVDGYIEAIEGTRTFENCISLANSGSVGTAFYEPFVFVASDHVTSLKRENTSQYVYLFLTAVLEQQGSNFNFNREINDLRIRKMRIMLPVNSNDEPDYQFMEDYMKELMVAKRKQYQEYVEQRLVKLGIDDVKNTKRGGYSLELESKEWKIFIVGDLFSVKRPIARNKDQYENGNVPFVASGSGNNGVMKCCKPHKNEELDNTGCITVSPVDGSVFYHPYNFLGRGGAGSSILMLYADNINLYNGQFIAKMIANTCACKYTYGHMGNKDSIKHERIMLPVNDNGEPNYEFMEDCGRRMMAKKYIQYLKYLESTCESSDLL